MQNQKVLLKMIRDQSAHQTKFQQAQEEQQRLAKKLEEAEEKIKQFTLKGESLENELIKLNHVQVQCV